MAGRLVGKAREAFVRMESSKAVSYKVKMAFLGMFHLKKEEYRRKLRHAGKK